MFVVDRRFFIIVLICCILGVLVITFILGLELHKASGYTTVDAKVIRAITKPSSGTARSKPNYIMYEFEVAGTKYQAIKQVVGDANNRVGKIERIKYNPQNPEEIENTYMIYAGFIAIPFIITFIVILTWQLATKRIS